MADLQAQVILGTDTNLPEDFVVNTWAFSTLQPAPDLTPAEVIRDGLHAFYGGIDTYLSPFLIGWVQIKIYDINAPKPRVPEHDFLTPNVITPGSSPLPEEVAVCLSFRGVLVSGQSPARRRGRVYLGPLTYTALQGDVSNRQRVDPGFLEDISTAYADAQTIWSAGDVVHSVWSRRNDDLVPVTYAWVDNALDTQRRRGPAPSQRHEVWPTSYP